jgi:hypothetical protein
MGLIIFTKEVLSWNSCSRILREMRRQSENQPLFQPIADFGTQGLDESNL